jgi:hypothetical protein
MADGSCSGTRWFPDLARLHARVTGQAVGVADVVRKRKAYLELGLQLFRRPSEAAGRQVAEGAPVPLAGQPQQGAAARDAAAKTHAAASAHVSAALGLHQGQAALLLRRWAASHAPRCAAGWVPSAAQTDSIVTYFLTQRWHLLSTLLHLADTAHCEDGAARRDARLALMVLGGATLAGTLLATARASISRLRLGLSFMSRTGPSTGATGANAADGALVLADAQCGTTASGVQHDAALCEICATLATALLLLNLPNTLAGADAVADADAAEHERPTEVTRIAAAAEDEIAALATCLQHDMLRLVPHVHEDTSSLLGLVARLATAVALSGLDWLCALHLRCCASQRDRHHD